jgi:hypothetical protein
MKKMCARSGISSREGESSVKGSTRAQFAKGAAARPPLCLSVGVRRSMRLRHSLNPNKEIRRDSS